MALEQIDYADKVDNRTTSIPANQRVIADDMNQIKTKFNALVTAVSTYLRQRIRVNITASDFTGGYYTNTNAIGLTPDVDVIVQSNDGSGVVLKSGDGYVFDAALGKFTMDRGNYTITIYKPLV
mgnify:CR=1 FL=1